MLARLRYLLLAIALPLCPALAADRIVQSLEGPWQRCTVLMPSDAPPATGWTEVKLPATAWQSPEGGTHAIWYQREIEIPADFANHRAFIDLRGARYTPQVFIDGKLVGPEAKLAGDGWSPVVVEITSAIKPGSKHTLAVRCLDRGAFFPEGFVMKRGMKDEELRGKTLNPVGGYKESIGFWDRVLLRNTNNRHIDSEELVIVTSTRKSTLSVSGVVREPLAGLQVLAEVIDNDKPVLSLPAVINPAGHFLIDAPFPNARYWSPEDPHLYTLRLSLRQGDQTIDSLSQRFGFKEIWTEGPDFYLNGVKRHILATSTWPNQGYEDPAEIRKRVQNIRDCNTIAFRMHTCPWQEAWLDAADELGLLMITEAAAYTDGSGMYGYTDPGFWDNYQKHIAGMIRRDRNRASLMMWSLGNEILFMGNQRYSKDLPARLGDLARATRKLDPHHPTTFEADIDPDGAYDVIGLHYPHEMPAQRDYPNTADWLGKRKDTEAAGGMLGQQATSGFMWKRDKPLYIGEYLWVPQGDYSCSTIWFGDAAFLNRRDYHLKAQLRSWYDQTIAYRRSGVSGLCPWTAFDFGGIQGSTTPPYLAQKEYFRPLAAYWSTRGLRYFAGRKASLSFDVFNDTTAKQSLELQLRATSQGISPASAKVELPPAGYAPITLDLQLPDVSADTDIDVESTLLADGKPVHTDKRVLRVSPEKPISAPAEKQLVIFDPSGKWPGSVTSLKTLQGANVDQTILLVANDVVATPVDPQIPSIGHLPPDTNELRAFLARGGRVVILEQADLGTFGLGVTTADHPSTMTFAIQATHPILKGLKGDDLCYWAPDNYVTRREIIRPSTGGAVGVTVTGGSDWLKHAPIVELPYGKGSAVLIQALAGSKRNIEPAAARLIQNAVDYAARRFPSFNTAIASDDPATTAELRRLAVDASDEASEETRLLILAGGGQKVMAHERAAGRMLDDGGVVYWHSPTPEAFAAFRDTIGGKDLAVRTVEMGVSLNGRYNSLLRGISREDVICTSRPKGWDRQMQFTPNAARIVVEPANPRSLVAMSLDTAKLSGGTLRDGIVTFDRAGSATFALPTRNGGIFTIALDASCATAAAEPPLILLEVNGVETAWFAIQDQEPRAHSAECYLRQGDNQIAVHFVNGSRYGGGTSVKIHKASASAEPVIPDGVELLTLPGAVVRWTHSKGRVVIDGINWDRPWPGQSDPRRFASALLANLGAQFRQPAAGAAQEDIALQKLKLVGESPYFGQARDQVSCYSNATLESPFDSAISARFSFAMRARGTAAGGEFPKVQVLLDDKDIGTLTAGPTDDSVARTQPVDVAKGMHTLRLVYANDANIDGQDRNLFIRQVGFIRE